MSNIMRRVAHLAWTYGVIVLVLAFGIVACVLSVLASGAR